MQLFRKDGDRLTISLFTQDILIFVMHMTGSIVLLFSRRELTYLFFALFQVIAVFAFIVLVRVIYPNSNRLILNHIALLLSISFVILTRISFARSIRQFIIVAVSMVVALIPLGSGEIPAVLAALKLCNFLFEHRDFCIRKCPSDESFAYIIDRLGCWVEHVFRIESVVAELIHHDLI